MAVISEKTHSCADCTHWGFDDKSPLPWAKCPILTEKRKIDRLIDVTMNIYEKTIHPECPFGFKDVTND
jgi:hypothetical protein